MGLGGEIFNMYPDNLFDEGASSNLGFETTPVRTAESERSSLLSEVALIGGTAGLGEVLRRAGSSMYHSENATLTQKALAFPVRLAGYGLLGAAVFMTTSKIAIACEEWRDSYREMQKMDEFSATDGY